MGGGGGEGRRERMRQRQKNRQTERQREKQRDRHRQRETQREGWGRGKRALQGGGGSSFMENICLSVRLLLEKSKIRINR